MEIKKLDDSKVDEVIKKAEKAAVPLEKTPVLIGSGEKKSSGKLKSGELLSTVIVLSLLALSLIQSVELLNVRDQLKNGQFGTSTASPAAGGNQALPTQQGGC